MAKYFGNIGFVQSYESSPGVWEDRVVERSYAGETYRNMHRWTSPDKVVGDTNINNEISIVMDPYTADHYHQIRYATLNRIRWGVQSVDIQYPRLILTMGGIYNGPTAETAENP